MIVCNWVQVKHLCWLKSNSDNSLEFDMGSFTNKDDAISVADSLPELDLSSSQEVTHLGMPDFIEIKEEVAVGNEEPNGMDMDFDLTALAMKIL